MDKYKVNGMSCAACQKAVTDACQKVDGVNNVNVNLLTNSVVVDGNYDKEALFESVSKAGYSLEDNVDKNDFLKDTTTIKLLTRFLISLGFLLFLMYLTMGHVMWGWPFFTDNIYINTIIEAVVSLIILIINNKFFVSGTKSLLKGHPNMDSLVMIGSFASYAYSVALTVLLFITKDEEVANSYFHNLYYESAAMIPCLITLGKTLESFSKGKTTNAIKALLDLKPNFARVIENGEEKIIPIDDLKVNDIFLVLPGEKITSDGVIIDGQTSVDESLITGESIPVDKEINNEVTGGALNLTGAIKCKTTKVKEDTALAQIIQMVTDANATKAPIGRIADKVSGVFVPTVMSIALVTFIVWMCINQDFGHALSKAISVLVISCPCALGLATPVAIMVGSGISARNGIMVKTSEALEQTGKVDIVCFDKTGTITMGKPVVKKVINYTEEDSLILAGSLEKFSNHPIALAITNKMEEDKLKYFVVTEFENVSGNGIKGKIKGEDVYVGSYKFISSILNIDKAIKEDYLKYTKEGFTAFLVATTKVLGMILVVDDIKPDAIEAIKQLHNMGIKTVMITGDNQYSANYIAKETGIDKVFSEVQPIEKQLIVKELTKQGMVAMIGDGINDAPALTCADIGIAIGAGTDVAIDSADVVLMKNNLVDVPAIIRISRRTLVNIKENLFWAFIYNIIGIPLAAGAYWFTHIELSPMIGAALMSMSSFCVVTNALRLNLMKPYKTKLDYKKKNHIEELNFEELNSIEFFVTGMHCPKCEKKVKDAIESCENVILAIPSHTDNNAIVYVKKPVDAKAIMDKINTTDFKCTGYDDSGLNNKKANHNTILIKVTGMHCPKCEKKVKDAAESVEGVVLAVASHEENSCIVYLDKPVDPKLIIDKINETDFVAEGYSFIDSSSKKEYDDIIISVTGMRCPNCEKKVKLAAEEVDGVLEAIPNRELNQCVCKINKIVNPQDIVDKINETDFKASLTEAKEVIEKAKECEAECCNTKNMKKLELEVTGMMCQHCEKTVRTAVEKLDGVSNVAASFEENKVTCFISKDVNPEDIVKIINDLEDYKALSYKEIESK